MDQKRIDQILSASLESVRNGLTCLQRKTHSFPAVYILLLEECGMYYIGSTSDLHSRITNHLSKLRRGKHDNGSFQKCYDAAKNKSFRVKYIRAKDRKEAYEIEQLLLDKHMDSGLLFNRFTIAETNGHGGKWSEEAKLKQSDVGKRNVEAGKLSSAWAARSRSVSIDGKSYPSIRAAARSLGMEPYTLTNRFNNLGKPGSRYRNRYMYTDTAPQDDD